MHFFYVDEAGCTGEDLANAEQPVFLAGGVIVRDEGWNITKERFAQLVSTYFNGPPPPNFELHSHELLSPNGQGPFAGHARDRRATFAHGILDMLAERNHHVAYVAIDKAKLRGELHAQLRTKAYLPRRAPYTVAYDYLISLYEWYTKARLGRSARGMIIADAKPGYESDISQVTISRREHVPTSQRVKWITEFTYAVDSHKNPMVQLSDFVCYTTKKFLEVDAGYRDGWNAEAKRFYRDLYSKIHDRLIKKDLLEETGRHSADYNEFMKSVVVQPQRLFRHRVY